MRRRGPQTRLGLIGCGRLAERGYMPALRRAPAARLVSVADPVIDRCRALAPEAEPHESGESLIAAGGIDAVLVATPADSHRAHAILAAEAGLAALVEKPPAADAGEAAEMAQLDPAPWIGFNRRFEPRLERLRSAVPAGASLDVSLELHNPEGSWGSHVVRDDALSAKGSHLIDLARWLTGAEVEGVRAAEVSARRAVLDLALDRGRATISCATDLPSRDRIEVSAADGTRLAYNGHGAIRRVWRRLTRPGGAGALVQLLTSQLEEFALVAQGNPPRLLAGAGDGLAVMAAIDGARLSAASGGSWHPIEPVIAKS